MVKIKVSVDSRVLDKKLEEIRRRAVSNELLTEIGETLVRMNAKNARTGKASDGSSFPPLSEKWKEQRGQLSNINKTHLAYSKNRSNVTFTGQLIDGLTYSINQINKSVDVYFNNLVRTPYKNLNGTSRKEILTNAEIAEYLSEKGWKLIGINQEMGDRIKFLIDSSIRSILNKK